MVNAVVSSKLGTKDVKSDVIIVSLDTAIDVELNAAVSRLVSVFERMLEMILDNSLSSDEVDDSIVVMIDVTSEFNVVVAILVSISDVISENILEAPFLLEEPDDRRILISNVGTESSVDGEANGSMSDVVVNSSSDVKLGSILELSPTLETIDDSKPLVSIVGSPSKVVLSMMEIMSDVGMGSVAERLLSVGRFDKDDKTLVRDKTSMLEILVSMLDRMSDVLSITILVMRVVSGRVDCKGLLMVDITSELNVVLSRLERRPELKINGELNPGVVSETMEDVDVRLISEMSIIISVVSAVDIILEAILDSIIEGAFDSEPPFKFEDVWIALFSDSSGLDIVLELILKMKLEMMIDSELASIMVEDGMISEAVDGSKLDAEDSRVELILDGVLEDGTIDGSAVLWSIILCPEVVMDAEVKLASDTVEVGNQDEFRDDGIDKVREFEEGSGTGEAVLKKSEVVILSNDSGR
ncbi:hypothetical protein G7054_g13364 [Neopestalotiopsis clavispora]|nr:hypothetical protein G7054_g13364 [Neopestalotiopsis clavispora]